MLKEDLKEFLGVTIIVMRLWTHFIWIYKIPQMISNSRCDSSFVQSAGQKVAAWRVTDSSTIKTTAFAALHTSCCVRTTAHFAQRSPANVLKFTLQRPSAINGLQGS